MRRLGLALLLLTVWLVPASAQYNPQAVFQTCPNTTAISQTANAQLITGTAGRKTYLCGLVVGAADLESLSLVGGTGTTCATGTYAIVGGTAASTGFTLVANTTVFFWSNTVSLPPPAAATTGDHVCLLQSGSQRVAGVVTWVQY